MQKLTYVIGPLITRYEEGLDASELLVELADIRRNPQYYTDDFQAYLWTLHGLCYYDLNDKYRARQMFLRAIEHARRNKRLLVVVYWYLAHTLLEIYKLPSDPGVKPVEARTIEAVTDAFAELAQAANEHRNYRYFAFANTVVAELSAHRGEASRAQLAALEALSALRTVGQMADDPRGEIFWGFNETILRNHGLVARTTETGEREAVDWDTYIYTKGELAALLPA